MSVGKRKAGLGTKSEGGGAFENCARRAVEAG